jgi:phospholipase/carboxylesterase
LPIFLAHGRYDPMISLARATTSRDALVLMGYDVEWHEYPMQHSVSQEEVADLKLWLQRLLGPKRG